MKRPVYMAFSQPFMCI